ncbi:MAG TPA: toll/interleukin-1 receptor domain-containing protein, partial [Fimbriimonas sp.]|nr:toll/interleukin-1 receptor domain-containing protein [Fimbriimonas sp.]
MPWGERTFGMAAQIDCFISYASPDFEAAARLHAFLVERGFSVWLDRERLRSGFDWYAHVKEAADTASLMLPVLTPLWQRSEWTKFETYAADRVIPLIFSGEWEEISTPPLQRFHFLQLDLTQRGGGWDSLESA